MSSNFSFNSSIPASNNNPSNDQPLMLQNNISTEGILAVDHVTFNTNNGGTHKQVTFSTENIPTSGSQTDPASVLYTGTIGSSGSFNTQSASPIAELFYLNQSGSGNNPITPFPISMIKAFGTFDNTGTSLNAWNIALQSPGGHPSAGNYIFTMPTNIITGDFYVPIITSTKSTDNHFINSTYSITSATQFSINFGTDALGNKDPSLFNILVLQL